MNTSKISRRQILEQANGIARSKGIQHLNIRDVAAKCQVSVGSIYNYFPTKSDLVVAVITEFWAQAYTHEDMQNISLDDFFHSYSLLYHKIYGYLKQFEGNWIHQLSLLDSTTKEKGKAMENDYFQNIRKMLMIMLERDQTIPQTRWNENFTKTDFVDFLFENTMIQLQKDVEEPTYLMMILKQILL